MSRLGIAFSGGPNPAEVVDLVDLAESLGYESAWVAEGHGGDQFANMPEGNVILENMIEVTSIDNQIFASHGDSGALVFARDEGRLVGLGVLLGGNLLE